MLRTSTLVLATVSTGKAATSGGTRRKSKWIDRRYKTPAHGGREVFQIGSHPSCELCHVRFRYKQDYMSHVDSDLHKSRVKWRETMSWWSKQGQPSLMKNQSDEWSVYVETIVAPAAEELGIPVESLVRGAHTQAAIDEAALRGVDLTTIPVPQTYVRTARADDTAYHHVPIQPPTAKPLIPEPKDNRWPYSPKW